MFNNAEQLQEKWKPLLEHDGIDEIKDNHRKAVTAVLLENQERFLTEERSFLSEAPTVNTNTGASAGFSGGATATGNFHVTAALASITFFAIIIAGTKAHGFIKHWKNLVPHGLAWPVYIILIPIEIMGMIVKPFALTMRLAANMTGGHIAILALLSLMAIFAEIFQSTVAGIGVALISVPMATAISGLEIIVVLVQAYVFTLLTAVFIGMAINVHH